MLSGRHRWIVEFNPLAYLIDIVRQPLVGIVPSLFTWSVAVVMAAIGWLLALAFTGRYHQRLPYWV
jgi:lipopolysaccharide transport system permease protein